MATSRGPMLGYRPIAILLIQKLTDVTIFLHG